MQLNYSFSLQPLYPGGIGGWVGHKYFLDTVEKRESLEDSSSRKIYVQKDIQTYIFVILAVVT
jgi:hypothetical protein